MVDAACAASLHGCLVRVRESSCLEVGPGDRVHREDIGPVLGAEGGPAGVSGCS